MTQKRCVVIREELSSEDIQRMRIVQRNTSTLNSRNGEGTAFSKALNGSKKYLKAQKFINDSEEVN